MRVGRGTLLQKQANLVRLGSLLSDDLDISPPLMDIVQISITMNGGSFMMGHGYRRGGGAGLQVSRRGCFHQGMHTPATYVLFKLDETSQAIELQLITGNLALVFHLELVGRLTRPLE